MLDLVIRQGNLVLPTGVVQGDLGISGGIITAMGNLPRRAANEEIDATGSFVFPAAVDAHIHFNDPGLPDREDFYTGTLAAAAGGTGTVIDMPLSGKPTVTDDQSLEMKKSAAASKAVVDYALWGGLVSDNVNQLDAMAEGGAIAFKAFTCDAGHNFAKATPDVLYRGMVEAKRLNLPVGVHCEDQALIEVFKAQAQQEQLNGVPAFLRSHCSLVEEAAVEMMLRLARNTGARTHLCHATLPSVVDMVQAARSEAAVTVETCPHYLLFTAEDLEQQQGILKCTPPLRSSNDREELWKRVLQGHIDMISSDHSPSTVAQKRPPDGSFSDAWGGVAGVQTFFSSMYSEGVCRRGMSPELLSRLVSTNPARIFGLYPHKGELKIGSDADCIIYDPRQSWRVSEETLYYKNKHSPLMGMELQGAVIQTLVRGTVVYACQGKIQGHPGFGRLLKPSC